MIYLLFGGAPNTGKTEAITRLANNYLIGSKNFTINAQQQFTQDFFMHLTGVNTQGNNIQIMVTTVTDQPCHITSFKNFCIKHGPYDFIISSIRDDGDPRRRDFFRIMNITSTDFIIEIPLGKITRINNFQIAKQWYDSKIDNIAQIILKDNPFFI